MPRPKSFTSDQLADRALQHFWANGFHASSMDDLVKATGVSRHGIYQTLGDKRGLFLACFDQYQKTIVTPAFDVVETEDADLNNVAEYFDRQIALAESVGLPGPGCFVANSATEVAPDDPGVLEQVDLHNDRLRQGYLKALLGSSPSLDETKARELADVMVIFTNGLWTMSRSVSSGDTLRRSVRNFLNAIAEAIK